MNLLVESKAKVMSIDVSIHFVYDYYNEKYYIVMGKKVESISKFFYDNVYSLGRYPVKECLFYLIEDLDGSLEVDLEEVVL